MPDVRLPNGTIIRGVPEGATREQIMQKAIQAGMATPEDFQQATGPQMKPGPATRTGMATPQQQPQPQQQEPGFLDRARSAGVGTAETLGRVGSSIIAEPLAGLAGLAGTALPGDPGQGARTVERVRDALTYDPRTEAGQRGVEGVGSAVQGAVDLANVPISGLGGLATLASGKGVDAAAETVKDVQERGTSQTLGDKVLDLTGSPELAAMAHTLPAATLEAIGIKGGRMAAGSAPSGGALSPKPGVALSQASPPINRLKEQARNLYGEIDEAGVRVDQNDFLDFAINVRDRAAQQGFDPELTPKSNALLKRIEGQLGEDMTLSELDQTRKAAQIAAQSIDNPTDAAIGSMVIDQIDEMIDTQGLRAAEEVGGDVGAKFREARNLWGRARRAEMIDDVFTRAQNQASGFENGLRIQFRQILNNPKKKRRFNNEEIEAMQKVVQGGGLENTFKFLGKFGLTEGQRTNALMSMIGMGAGYGIGGPLGAVVVPGVGQVSMQTAQNLTRRNARFVDDIVRAGASGPDVVKAYLRNTPKRDRNIAELTELLIRPGVSVEDVGKRGPVSQLVRDAGFAANQLKDLGITSFAAAPAVIEGTTDQEEQQ